MMFSEPLSWSVAPRHLARRFAIHTSLNGVYWHSFQLSKSRAFQPTKLAHSKALPGWKLFVRLSLSICFIENSSISPCIIMFIFISDWKYFLRFIFHLFVAALPTDFSSCSRRFSSFSLSSVGKETKSKRKYRAVTSNSRAVSHRDAVHNWSFARLRFVRAAREEIEASLHVNISTDAHEFSLFK